MSLERERLGEVTQKVYEKMQKRNVTSLEEMAVNEPGCSQVDFSGSSGLYGWTIWMDYMED